LVHSINICIRNFLYVYIIGKCTTIEWREWQVLTDSIFCSYERVLIYSAVKNYRITLLLWLLSNFFLYQPHFFVSNPLSIYRFRCILSIFIAINTGRAHLNLYIDGDLQRKSKIYKEKFWKKSKQDEWFYNFSQHCSWKAICKMFRMQIISRHVY